MPIEKALALGTTIAQDAAKRLDAPRVLILTQESDGSTVLYTHGFLSHAQINNVLSVGIHANLSDHDRFVLAGAAGEEAQEVARHIQLSNAS